MAIVAERQTESRKSTAPPIFFNEPESADRTPHALQHLDYAVQTANTFLGRESKGLRIFISDSVSGVCISGVASGVYVSTGSGEYVSGFGQYVSSSGVYVFGSVGNVVESYHVSGRLAASNQPAESSFLWDTVPSLLDAAASWRAAIEGALRRVQEASGVAKAKARTEAVQAIIRAGTSTEVLDHAVRSIIGVHRSGRLDDAIDILSELGRVRIRSLAETWWRAFAADGTNDDYWYAVIRAAGRSGDRGIPKKFLDSRFVALKEAAVEALGDIGDPVALEDLRQVAGDSDQPDFIRELAKELELESASNENPVSPVR